ncbi:MAG: hypothetical protein NDI94_02720 [Candidatus Woesearchaeota archaeon]|nr:hypothetical protein [Candidatus Woesearchaeota archaeon]
MKSNYINLFIMILVLSSCQRIDDDLKFRIDSLYEHTVLMGEYSTEEQLDSIGLDMSYITMSEGMSAEDKVSQMNQAFGIAPSRDIESQVARLEEKMNEMMEEWSRLQ